MCYIHAVVFVLSSYTKPEQRCGKIYLRFPVILVYVIYMMYIFSILVMYGYKRDRNCFLFLLNMCRFVVKYCISLINLTAMYISIFKSLFIYLLVYLHSHGCCCFFNLFQDPGLKLLPWNFFIFALYLELQLRDYPSDVCSTFNKFI